MDNSPEKRPVSDLACQSVVGCVVTGTPKNIFYCSHCRPHTHTHLYSDGYPGSIPLHNLNRQTTRVGYRLAFNDSASAYRFRFLTILDSDSLSVILHSSQQRCMQGCRYHYNENRPGLGVCSYINFYYEPREVENRSVLASLCILICAVYKVHF